MGKKKRLCGDCARFTPVNECDGECSKHGYTTCSSFFYCKDFSDKYDKQKKRCNMKEFEFGTHIHIPAQTIDISEGVNSYVSKIAVQMQEKIDEAIIREIVKAAKEQGITDLYILDKQNIIAAMRKQMPMKVLETTLHGNVEAYHCKNCFNRVATFINGNLVSGKIQKHCDECGQKLDMSEVFK